MKKIIVFITLIILLITLVVFFLLNNKKVEEKESVVFFFDLVEKDTDISFLNTQSSILHWKVVDENNDVITVEKSSKNAEIKNITESESEKLNNFFEENGFELDIYNLADSPQGSVKGYRKNKMYCIVTQDYKLSDRDAITSIDMNINCAI